MENRVFRVALMVIVLSGALCAADGGNPTPEPPDEAPKELIFVPLKIDGPVHDPAKHTYWFGPFAECSSVLDINGDGKPDVAAGRNYYLAPHWAKYSDYRDGAEVNGPDVDDNYEGTMDVNNDGRPDVLSSGWMRRQGIWWYENPGEVGVKWNSHALHPADGLEGMVIGNLAGHDGKDVLVNYFAKKPGRGLIWFEHLDQAPWFKEHALGPENVGVSHGSGIGDINGDGRDDVVTTSGWFESPPRPTEEPWTWHHDYQFTPYGSDKPGGAGLPILVTDVNGDGLNDIIIGSDHGYGLAWYEQKMDGGRRTFIRHWIETDYPTFHTMILADLDGDGRPELITGKQLFAHNGGDVGGFEPVFVFYYKFQKGRFERHILSYSYLQPYFTSERNGPPPNFVVGVGMRLQAADMDSDGRLDVVVACRTGLYIFFNKGYSPKTRDTNYLPSRESYPSHALWAAPQRPAQKKKQ
ncbi:MAG: VCBS repeat-containing protein [Candidatus Hydrogenedentes bacterium]|nr:VCBS repeat-containing protein [Candidatus Hydrogenedentota bacterium]